MRIIRNRSKVRQTEHHLVGQFMCDNGHHPLFIGLRGDAWLIQHGRLSVGDKSPVLHRPRREVWDSDHVWKIKQTAIMKY